MAHLRVALLTLALLLLTAASGQAVEILELDHGSMVFDRTINRGATNLQGSRLGITGFIHVIGLGPGWGFEACAGAPGLTDCNPGARIATGGTAVGGDVFAQTTLEGVSHPAGGAEAGLITDGLALGLFGTVLIPAFGDISSVVLKAPFTLTGTLSRNDCFPASALFCATNPFYGLHGQGTLTLALDRVTIPPDIEAWRWREATFDLQPIPEPATLVLWGASAAVFWVARQIRRRQRPSPDTTLPLVCVLLGFSCLLPESAHAVSLGDGFVIQATSGTVGAAQAAHGQAVFTALPDVTASFSFFGGSSGSLTCNTMECLYSTRAQGFDLALELVHDGILCRSLGPNPQHPNPPLCGGFAAVSFSSLPLPPFGGNAEITLRAHGGFFLDFRSESFGSGFFVGGGPGTVTFAWNPLMQEWQFVDGVATIGVGEVPEPATLALWGVTAAALGVRRWRRHRPVEICSRHAA